MKKLFILVSLLFVFTTIATGQQGTAMLKIVKSEDGQVKVYNMQSKEIFFSQDPIKSKLGDLMSMGDPKALQETKKDISNQQAMNPGPDLDIVPANCSFSYNPSTHQLIINVRVINAGTSTAIWSYLGYYVSTNAAWSVGDYRIGNDRIGSNADHYGNLNPGAYVDNTITVDISTVTSYPTLPCGTHTYYVGFILDYTNKVAEDDEDNFWGWVTPSISFPRCSTADPNLTAMGQPASFNFNGSNCSLTIDVRVKNDGAGAAGSSILGYYLSSNTTISTGDCKLGIDLVSALSAGAYSDETIFIPDISSIGCVSNGTWYVGFLIDENNTVAESNESDNSYYFSPAINVTCVCSPEPNLTSNGQPASFNYDDSNCSLTIDVRVKNDGDGAAGSSSTLGYYLSSDNTITTSDCKLGTDIVPALAAGAYTDETITISDICSISCVSNGTWYIGFLIDENSDVAESNEGDNEYYFTPSINITCCDQCGITVTVPHSGIVWDEGSSQTISWNHSGTCTNVKIEYSTDNGSSWTTITSSAPNDGSYAWTLPEVTSTQSDCIVRVICTTDASCTDMSSTFTIRNIDPNCLITVTNPHSGDVWDEGSAQTISWDHSGPCTDVKIEYSTNNGSSWMTVASSTANDGSYSWTVPEVTSTQSDCKVRVTCTTDLNCTDMSDTFTIRNIDPDCPLTVLVPNCNVNWREGEQYKISWIPAAKSGYVKIEYGHRFDSGQVWSWTTIIESTEDDGCYCWTIPVPDPNPANIRAFEKIIRITDTVDPSCSDESDVPFIISNVDLNSTSHMPYIIATDITGPTGSNVICDVLIGGNTNPIDAISLNFLYDINHLSFVEIQKGDLTSGWSIPPEGNENTPGVIIVGGLNFGGAPIAIGSAGILFKVVFQVTCTACNECDQSHFGPSNLIEDLAGMNAFCGTYSFIGCCVCGDVNKNGVISSEDALCAFRIYLAGGVIPPGFPECDNECALRAADANKNGIVSSEDALGIFKYYLQGYWDPGFCGPTLSKRQLRSYGLILDEIVGQPGDVVKVLIKVDNPEGISAFGLELRFPSDLLEYVATSKTSVTKDWIALDGNEARPGIITLGGFHPDAISISSTTTIAEVSFLVKKEADGKGSLNIENLTDDLAESFVTAGSFITSDVQLTPTAYKLAQNYPNPFNMETEIIYQLPDEARVKVIIYNISGQKIRTLVDSNMNAGVHIVRWDGKNDSGDDMVSGIYVFKMETNNIILSKKMILMK